MSIDLRELSAALQDLEERVRDLRLRVSAIPADSRPVGAGSSSGESAGRPQPWSLHWEEQLLQARSPEEALVCDLSPIDSERGTLSTSAGWNERARLGRALRAGIEAKRCLCSGNFRVTKLPDLQVRIQLRVVLFCPDRPEGFWSRSSRPFFNFIGDATGRGQGPDPPSSVFGSFATEKEASAYLLGAGRPWPPQQ